MKQIIPFFLTVILTPILAGIINSLWGRVIFLFAKEKVKDEIPIKTLLIDSKLAFIFLLPGTYVFCFYSLFYFFSAETVSFFQPVRRELVLAVGVMGGFSFICHLLFSERINLYQDKVVIEKIFLGSKEIEWGQVISIEKKSVFLFPRLKNLVFTMKDESIVETRIPEYYLEAITALHKDIS